jgi:hypothetical protein
MEGVLGTYQIDGSQISWAAPAVHRAPTVPAARPAPTAVRCAHSTRAVVAPAADALGPPGVTSAARRAPRVPT